MGVAVASANRIGCYKGNQGPGYTNHLGQLKWFGNEGTGKLTPQLCQDHCSAGGSKYYALVWGEQCGCMNNLSGEKVGDGECNQPCVGDYSKKCGGSYSGDRNPADVYQIGGGGSQQPKHPPSPLPRNPPSLLLLLVRTSRQQTGAAPNATTRRNAPVRRAVSRNARRPAVSAMMALSTLGQLALVSAPPASMTIARFWTSPCSSTRPRGPDTSQLANVLNGVVTAISVMILRAVTMMLETS